MKNVGNILVVSVSLFASLVLLIDRSRAGLCSSCKVTLPNIINKGDACSFNRVSGGRTATYNEWYV
jgi:hypothetical protein